LQRPVYDSCIRDRRYNTAFIIVPNSCCVAVLVYENNIDVQSVTAQYSQSFPTPDVT